MGMADFYLKFRFNDYDNTVIKNIYKKLQAETIFLSNLEQDENKKNISIECKFDNMIPSLIILYEIFNTFSDSIISVETYGIIQSFKFTHEKDFINFVYSSNRNKMISYYKEMGYLAINANNYYKSRNKLKKHYQRLK